MAREFRGTINIGLKDSTEDWDAFLPDQAPDGAPNVLVILYDDTGQAAWSPYGGRIEMPTLQRIADRGLTYTQWHTTALCSPTRSTFLTGRNHHQNGFASISETALGFPGYSSRIPTDCAPMATVLRDAGWSTFWVGKNHNVPVYAWTAGSSKKEWPLAMGYDRFYGFIGGETNQWYPDLVEDNHYTEQPYLPEDGYHLSKDLADKALEFIRDSKQSEPEKPWYLWFCPGANHAPHHAPEDYIAKYKGKFDDGYEAYREWVLPRMIERGILPEGTELSALNPLPPEASIPGDAVRPWDELSDEEKALFSRMAEVYAAYSEYTDVQVGRIIDYLEESGQLDNTLVIYAADNGASGEGSPNGSVNENKIFNSYPDLMEDNLPLLDELGSPATYNHYPTGWAAAFSTPYKMFKRYTYQGGIADPLVISWPAGIRAKGEVRTQYHHCTDIVPTILDVCGVAFPETYNGVTQKPLPGVSMRYSFDAEVDTPTQKVTQYYEMLGSRGLWHDGWKAVTEHGPMSGGGMGGSFQSDTWQLFHTDVDRSEVHDLASEQPDKLEELKALWYAEAGKFDVLPLNDYNMGKPEELAEYFSRQYHVSQPKSGRFIYYPGTSEVPEHSAANTHNRSFKVFAELTTAADTEGVVFAQGARFGGQSMFVKDGRLHYSYNFLGLEEQTIDAPLPEAGEHVFGVEFQKEGMDEHFQPTGTMTLYIDDQAVASASMRTLLLQFTLCGEGLCVGYDGGDAVSAAYAGQRFDYRGGAIDKVVFDLADDHYLDVEKQLAALLSRD
ncbi:arylsulfatase [Agromyces mediolanus]|uniref:arylsulfatase n=1 Tax=Agromyces mediolanus TaxID=41986 RepID=UPI0027E1983E|nr:arylsulfatase [Agromyces mediolanus]